MKNPYTLLADGNLRFSTDESYYKAFKAHLLHVLLFNEHMVLSDNQVVGSSNLRRLVSRDGVIRDLFRQKSFSLAVRSNFDGGDEGDVRDLEEIQRDFLKENKITAEQTVVGNGSELAFMKNNANIIPWKYWDVRNNYTKTCRKTLIAQFRPLLSNSDLDRLVEILDEENSRDRGLGRAFLQSRLYETMRTRLSALPENARSVILEATEAPYVSNLPSVLDLTPIYAESHQKSFQILRGTRFEMVDIGEPVDLKASLDYAHYIEGLTRLGVDDIIGIRESRAMRDFWQKQDQEVKDESSTIALQHAYLAVNVCIEKKIIEKFPELKISTGTPERREIRRTWARIESGAAAGLDLFGIALGAVGVPTPLMGTGLSYLFELFKKRKIGDEGDAVVDEIAHHQMSNFILSRHLERVGKNQKMLVTEKIFKTDSFDKEIIVA